MEEGEDRKAEGPGDEEEDLYVAFPFVSMFSYPTSFGSRNASQNDALLHRLIHTKLLSGPFASETDVSPAKRRKAFSGRIIEVAGQAKLGKGESAVRSSETNRAAKKVRDGLLAKQRERNAKALEEVCAFCAADVRNLMVMWMTAGKTYGQLSPNAEATLRLRRAEAK